MFVLYSCVRPMYCRPSPTN